MNRAATSPNFQIRTHQGIELEALHEKLRTGNLDPREVDKAIQGQKRDFPNGIAECGADALRFGLLAYSAQGRDINLDIQRVVAYRQFCNKLWNATKFALLNFDDDFTRPTDVFALVKEHGSFADRWILSQLAAAVKGTNTAFEQYDFAQATTTTYNFWLYHLCDYYLELIKPIVRGDNPKAKETALAVLFICLDYGLRLLHPMMPFVTDELYHRLPKHKEHFAAMDQSTKEASGSIMVQPFPSVEKTSCWEDPKAEADMQLLQEIVHASRSAKSSVGVANSCDIYVVCADETIAKSVSYISSFIATLAAKKKKCVILTAAETERLPKGCVSSPVSADIVLHLPVLELLDLVKEASKINKQRTKLSEVTEVLREKTSSPIYAKKTPQKTQEEHAAKLAEQDGQLAKLDDSINQLVAAMTSEQYAKFYGSLLAEAEKELKSVHDNTAKLQKKCEPGVPPPKKIATQLDANAAKVAVVQGKIAALRSKLGIETAPTPSSTSEDASKKDAKVAPAPAEGQKALDAKRVKACIKEGGKKGQDLSGMSAFGCHFFCTAFDEPQGEMEYLQLCMEGANTEVDPEAEERKGGAGDLGKIFFSAGDNNLAMICHVPKECKDKVTIEEWFGCVCESIGASMGPVGELFCNANVPADPDNDKFPLKMRDVAISAGYDYLRTKGLVLDDDSEDDINFADDAGKRRTQNYLCNEHDNIKTFRLPKNLGLPNTNMKNANSFREYARMSGIDLNAGAEGDY